MNIEVNEDAAVMTTVSLIFIGLFTCISFGCHQSEKGATERKRMEIEQQAQIMKDGFTQQLEPDHFVPVWKKK